MEGENIESPEADDSANLNSGNNVSNTTSSDTITIKKDSLWKYSTFVLAAILIVGAFVFFMGDKNSAGPTGNVVEQPGEQLPTQPTSKVEVNIEGAPFKGENDAPVVMVEYSDYECPFCGRFYSQTLPQIQKEYIDTGKVKLVYKDFPLSFHPNAQKAAESAECARDQKKDDGYWNMHDKIFENQQSINVENYKKWAREIGLNGAQFDSCLDSDKFASAVQKDFNEGTEDGVQGTPAFFINGKLISGAQPFSAFKQAIDAELAK